MHLHIDQHPSELVIHDLCPSDKQYLRVMNNRDSMEMSLLLLCVAIE